LIVRAEERGVSSAWSTVGGSNPDAVTLFAAAATRTHQILLVSGEPGQVAARLVEIRAAGMDELLVHFMPVADEATEEAALFTALTAVGAAG
jgi:alkanesulfonate monooxygenase SsuD/methylene tetrahydromethanopterin reductase-like flavin-dependent oxidoreductase (luciferase family)